MTEEKALIEIKEAFTINGELNERYYHTLGVIEKALELNEIHNLKIPKEQVFLSAAFHDVAKFLDKKSMLEILDKYFHNIHQSLLEYPSVWHSFVGKIVAREKYGITDDRILNAICYHTTGRPNMTNLEKIIFISDYVEEKTRVGECFEIARKVANKSLNDAIVVIIEQTIAYLKKNNKPVYQLTEETYQFYLKEVKKSV